MMKNRYKDTLLTRSKKYDYKVWEHQYYDEIGNYVYNYFITNYNEDSMIICKVDDYKEIQRIVNKLRGNK